MCLHYFSKSRWELLLLVSPSVSWLCAHMLHKLWSRLYLRVGDQWESSNIEGGNMQTSALCKSMCHHSFSLSVEMTHFGLLPQSGSSGGLCPLDLWISPWRRRRASSPYKRHAAAQWCRKWAVVDWLSLQKCRACWDQSDSCIRF